MTKQAKINKLRKETKELNGVYLDVHALNAKRSGIFKTILNQGGVKHYLGYHVNANEAAKAYNKKAKSLFGSEKAAKAAGFWNNI